MIGKKIGARKTGSKAANVRRLTDYIRDPSMSCVKRISADLLSWEPRPITSMLWAPYFILVTRKAEASLTHAKPAFVV